MSDYFSNEVLSPSKAAYELGVSSAELEILVKNGDLGFSLSDHGMYFTKSHLADFLLGYRPLKPAPYKPGKPARKAKKRYPKARTRR